jgi:glycosyltransferase involved in cell wall biosynthesis
LKIAILGNLLAHRHRTGIETYLYHLIQSLADLEALRLTVLCHDPLSTGSLPDNVQLQHVTVPRGLKKTTLVPIVQDARMLDQYDLLHCPTVMAPLGGLRNGKLRTVMTVHDMVPALFPQLSNLKKYFYYKYVLKFFFSKIDHLIVPSESVKKDLCRLHAVSPDRVSVVYEGVSRKFRTGKKQKGNYILAVGTLEPRKNLNRLIAAFMQVKTTHHIKDNLVIVGKPGWCTDDLYHLPADFKKSVVFKGYVPDNELIELYQEAKAFVYPSLYEGFGLPVIEAMACGCPVITSNLSSLPEVSGNACLLVDPYSVNHIAEAIVKILKNWKLAQILTEKGLKRVKQFTWTRCALETQSVYESVLHK